MGILDDLDEPLAESWIPSVDDKLVITVTAKDINRGAYGDYVVLTGDVQEGSTLEGKKMKLPQTRALHCLGTVLSGEVGYQSGTDKDPQGSWIDRDKVRIGDTFGVKYLGKVERDKGPGYHSWKVKVVRPTIADQLDVEGGADEADVFG